MQTGCLVAPGAPIKDDPADAVLAVYHSHPFSHGDLLPQNCGRDVPTKYDAKGRGGPSRGDWEFADDNQIPNYVIDLDNVYRADPGVLEDLWRNNPNRFSWNKALCGL